MFEFTVGGKKVRSEDFGKAMESELINHVKAEIRERLGAVRHPETGEFPTVAIHGDTLEDLTFRVEGSPELLALPQEQFSEEDLAAMSLEEKSAGASPRAFLSFAWEDHNLAERLARELRANGIDTWWAEWEIGAGDSMRQKIDEGLEGCTHFLVLLTPNSKTKPWVNQEMDAGLVKKLRSETKFIPVRYQLAAEDLPPLLSGLHSPAIDDFENSVPQLINDIHGLTQKPPLGQLPQVAEEVESGHTKAATAVARVFVEASETAMFGDPQLTISDIAEQTSLTVEDVRDALHELRWCFTVSHERVLPKDELFAEFDKFFMKWNPEEDALRIASDLINDDNFPGSTIEAAQRYGWGPRRINPALAYLIARDLIRDCKAMGTQPWLTAWVQKKGDATRRFVKSRN